METAALSVSKRPTQRLSAFSVVLTEWLRKWARLHSIGRNQAIELTEEDFAIYAEALSDLTPEQLDAACLKAQQVCQFFPKPGEIRGQLEQAEAKGFELEAEREWESLLAWTRENVFPDTGIRRGAPGLTPVVHHAASAAGGVYFLERCREDQLVWARKTFLAAFKNVHETQRVEHLLPDCEARRILSDLTIAEPRPQIHSGLAAGTIAPTEKPGRREVREVLDRVTKPVSLVDAPTEEELREQWEDQKRRLAVAAAGGP
jgi:hypothetical protein